ncbi:thioredoxin family protein [Granulicella cerasi]|uniref:Thioredoxin family protein n=1 Tax=Granulicella cerasi TaxID=741063 RepID=A0ABW1ZBL6_9BACT|nr:thioredoxin family protein [Granulicella cerasi]
MRHPLRTALAFTGIALSLIAMPRARAAEPGSANAIFEHARTEASAGHKNVLLVFSASWCGPCKLYERFLDDPKMKAITEKGYVVERIDVGERADDTKHTNTPGGEKLRSQLGAAAEPGFPFLIVTDAAGKPLVNSYLKGDKSNNIGYPVLPAEIDWYIAMLQQTAPSLSPQDLADTRAYLEGIARRIHH